MNNLATVSSLSLSQEIPMGYLFCVTAQIDKFGIYRFTLTITQVACVAWITGTDEFIHAIRAFPVHTLSISYISSLCDNVEDSMWY